MPAVPKADIENRVQEAAILFMEAKIEFLHAFVTVETESWSDAAGYLERSSALLDEVVSLYVEILDLAAERQQKDTLKQFGSLLSERTDSPHELGDRIFEDLRRQAETNDLLLDDPDHWKFFVSKSLLDQPRAGYQRYTWLLRETRNSVDGFRSLIENDAPVDVLQEATWKTCTQFMRTMNCANTLGYINRETRKY